MSRVLARNLFKKNAPKKSAHGVGITSMFDDEPGYAEGGEVNEDRTERERVARMLLEKNKDEMELYQRFSEGERPQMTRLPATVGVVQQPNPQQIQAMQAQQMAQAQQMGLVPRFAEGGPVNAVTPASGPIETPSMWSGIRTALGDAIGMRGRADPMFARGSGPQIGGITDPALGSPGMDNPEFRYREPTVIPADATSTDPMGGYTGGTLPPPPTPDQGFGLTGAIPRAMLGLPTFKPGEKPAPSEEEQAAMEAARESRKAKAFSNLPKKAASPDKAAPEDDTEEDTTDKTDKTDLTSIKADREAKAAAAKRENMWLAAMQAGLAIMGGKSSNAMTNIGQGGQAGLASFMALEQQRRRDEDAAMRRDISERELQLQQRRLAMQEPYYKAQTQYMLSKEGRDAAQLKAREYLAGLQAQKAAEQAWVNELKNNQMTYMKMDDAQKAIARDIFIKRKTQELFQEKKLGLTPGVGAPASRETETSPEE